MGVNKHTLLGMIIIGLVVVLNGCAIVVKDSPSNHSSSRTGTALVSWYYYPNSRVYYHVTEHYYYYPTGDKWHKVKHLPRGWTVSKKDRVLLKIAGKPYLKHAYHQKRYPTKKIAKHPSQNKHANKADKSHQGNGNKPDGNPLHAEKQGKPPKPEHAQGHGNGNAPVHAQSNKTQPDPVKREEHKQAKEEQSNRGKQNNDHDKVAANHPHDVNKEASEKINKSNSSHSKQTKPTGHKPPDESNSKQNIKKDDNHEADVATQGKSNQKVRKQDLAKAENPAKNKNDKTASKGKASKDDRGSKEAKSDEPDSKSAKKAGSDKVKGKREGDDAAEDGDLQPDTGNEIEADEVTVLEITKGEGKAKGR